jgi:hypothetical protein
VKHPLLLVALCATGAVAVLSGTAIAAFAAPVGAQTATVSGIAPLTVPLGYHPSSFAAPPISGSRTGDGLVIVGAAGAVTLEGSPAASNSAGASESPSARAARESHGNAGPSAAASTEAAPRASTPAAPVAPGSAASEPANAPSGESVPTPAEAASSSGKPEKPAKPEKPEKPTKVEDVKSVVGAVVDGTGLGGLLAPDDKSGKKAK